MNNIIISILSNQTLAASILAWFVAQTLKAIILASKQGKFKFNLYALPGGFPSSHSASVSAMACSVGLNHGFDSALFAVSIIFAFFVLYDARVIRGAAGKQSQSLNIIIESLNLDETKDLERLKEVLGHNLFEIFIGALIGIACALFFFI
jgi:uncharacterized protein